MNLKDAIAELSKTKQVLRVWQEVVGHLGTFIGTDTREANGSLATDDGEKVDDDILRAVIETAEVETKSAEKTIRELLERTMNDVSTNKKEAAAKGKPIGGKDGGNGGEKGKEGEEGAVAPAEGRSEGGRPSKPPKRVSRSTSG